MAQMLQIQQTRYKDAFGFLSDDMPTISTRMPDVWRAFLQNSHLEDAEAKLAITMNGTAPLIFASELGMAVYGQFDPTVPGRIEISTDVLDQFASAATNPDAQRFLRAKVLHEVCHWACFEKGVPDNDQSGEAFEDQAFGEELPPWWTSSSAPTQDGVGNVFEDAQARANVLRALLGKSGFAPGRLEDPNRAVFGGADVAEAMPRGFRNNNPGNIRISSSNWRGLADPIDETDFQRREQSFCVFREPEWGLRALAILLRKYKTEMGLDTPRKIISRWAPASDNNDVTSYAEQLAKALGIGPDGFVDATDSPSLITIMRAIARYENGDRPPYADTQYQVALLLI